MLTRFYPALIHLLALGVVGLVVGYAAAIVKIHVGF
jgi:hypothetical protein